jgi:hypothetical protein
VIRNHITRSRESYFHFSAFVAAKQQRSDLACIPLPLYLRYGPDGRLDSKTQEFKSSKVLEFWSSGSKGSTLEHLNR